MPHETNFASFGYRIGIECFDAKVTQNSSFQAVQIGCAFFVTFFAQANKVNECAHETKVSPVSAPHQNRLCFLCYFLLGKQKKGG